MFFGAQVDYCTILPAETTDNNGDLLRCCNSRNAKRSYVVQSTCSHNLTKTKINNLNKIVIAQFKIIVLDATVVCTHLNTTIVVQNDTCVDRVIQTRPS